MNNGYDKFGRPADNFSPPPFTPDGRAPLKRPTCSPRDMVFVLLCLITSIISVDFLFWSGAGIGISICSSAFLILSLAYLCTKGIRMSSYTVLLSLLYFALGASLTFSDGGLPKFTCLLLMATAYTVIIIDAMDLRRRESGTFKSIGDVMYGLFGMTFGKIGRTWYAVFHKEDGELIVTRKTGSIFIGFAFSIPVLCVIIPLLTSSDAAFEGLMEKITFGKVWELVLAIIIGAFFFILWFGQLFAAGDTKVEKIFSAKNRRGIEPTVLASFLSVISIAYVLYLFSQLAYLWSGFSGLLPEGFTLAEYARRGFFEMTAVCALNLLFIFTVMVICRKKDGRRSLAVRVPASFLCFFSLFLIASCLSKMILYINSYGMTRLRIYTSVFMIFLAVLLTAVFLRLYIKKVPYMKVALIAAAVLTAAMCFCDVDGVIAKYNVDAYVSGKLPTVDLSALGDLSSDAVVPYVFELIDDKDEYTAEQAKMLLTERAYETFTIEYDDDKEKPEIIYEDYDFRRFNVHEYRARKILFENFDEYYTTIYRYDGAPVEFEPAQ